MGLTEKQRRNRAFLYRHAGPLAVVGAGLLGTVSGVLAGLRYSTAVGIGVGGLMAVSSAVGFYSAMLSYGSPDNLRPYQRFMRRRSVRGVAAVVVFGIAAASRVTRILE